MMIQAYCSWGFCAAMACFLVVMPTSVRGQSAPAVELAQQKKDDASRLQKELDALRAEYEQRAKDLAKERERAEKKEKEKSAKSVKETKNVDKEILELEKTLQMLRRDFEKLNKELDARRKGGEGGPGSKGPKIGEARPKSEPSAPPRVIYVPVPYLPYPPFFQPFQMYSPLTLPRPW